MTNPARQAHQRVKAYYATVAYRLTDGQRRTMRTYLGRLTGMAHAHERAEWERLQGTPINEAPLHEHVRATMARARLTALSIADVVVPVHTAEALPGVQAYEPRVYPEARALSSDDLRSYAEKTKSAMDKIYQDCMTKIRIESLKASLQQQS